MVLLVLAGIWAAVLVPPVLRARAEGRAVDSIGSFRRQLRVLERSGPTTPAWPVTATAAPLGPSANGLMLMSGPPRETIARKRRREVFKALLVAIGGSLVLGAIPSLRLMWGVHLVLDVLFVGYVVLLIRMRNIAAERDLKVRYLPRAVPAPEPALALRRSAR